MTLKALIFDVDGTLAETERDGHRIAFNQAFADANLAWEWSGELYGELLKIAGGKERIFYYINQYQPEFNPAGNFTEFIANLHQLKTKHYQQLLTQDPIPLRPGVKRLINEARSQNIRLAIASTAALPNVIALLENSLDPAAVSWFEVIAAGDIVTQKKPAPDIYLYVLEKMGLNAKNCLVIEDSEAGLKAASQANLKTIITVNNYTKNQDFSQALLVLNHLGEPKKPFRAIAGNSENFSYLSITSIQQLFFSIAKS
jgi:HAD superfamily hydrolase (TIGR01509 family)